MGGGGTPAPIVKAGQTPAGQSIGGKRRRKVVIGDRLYEVDSLRDVEFLLKRIVREESAPVIEATKARSVVVDRIVADEVVQAVTAPPMPLVPIDWGPLWAQLAAQDSAYAQILERVLMKQEEDDIEVLLLLH